jgi:hypothetical protein
VRALGALTCGRTPGSNIDQKCARHARDGELCYHNFRLFHERVVVLVRRISVRQLQNDPTREPVDSFNQGTTIVRSSGPVRRSLSHMLPQPLCARVTQDAQQEARRLVLLDARERIDARARAHKLVHEPARRAEARTVRHDR